MEIPKSLQEEIHSLQNKLKNAIQNHQVYVGKLNDDPNNEELLGQLHDIQEHIISLSKCQKQVVQRLRKEVKHYEAANSNGTKVSIASLLGLNNNNNITNNNETKTSDEKKIVNGKNINGLNRRFSKDDYEDEIQNADTPSPDNNCQNNCAKGEQTSDETESNDEDVLEIAVTDNSNEKSNRVEIEIQSFDQLDFLASLGLITADKHTELQNKRAERKRRSTANPQFVYSNWEIPTKRKRHSYLQSNGTAPQTRQTTARLNGPSPPPHKVAVIKPSPLLTRAPVKSLVPTQKSSTRPNILRNNSESKLFTGIKKCENGSTRTQTPLSAKSVQSVGSKAVHIPGLPSSLTIERIENDSSAVCIHCRNPGSLTICEICATSFHVSCHVVSSAPPRTCPMCLTRAGEQESCDRIAIECKEEDEIATTSNASGNVREAREDAEIHKTACGFHKIDAEEERPISAALAINQLPPSTFLIPIPPNPVSASLSSSGSSSVSTIGISQFESTVSTSASVSGESNLSMPCTSILLDQLSKSTGVQSDARSSVTYQSPIPGVQQEKSQSYLVLKKISDSSASARRNKSVPSSCVARNQPETRNASAVFEYQQSSFTGYNDHDQSEIKSIPAASVSATAISPYMQSTFGQFSGKVKYNGQEFNGTEDTSSKPIFDGQFEFEGNSFSRDKSAGKSHSKLSINQLRPSGQSNTFIPLHSIIDDAECLSQFDVARQSESSGKIDQLLSGVASTKGKSKTNLLYSLFSSNNEPHSFPGRVINSQDPNTQQVESVLHSSQDKQSKHDTSDEPESRLQSSLSPNIAEYVKLEEAHIPAPLRPNLKRKSIDEIHVIMKKEQGSNSLVEDKCDDNGIMDVTSFEDYHNENLKATLDFIAFERDHSNTYIKFHDFEEGGDTRDEYAMKNHRQDKNKVSASCGVSESSQQSTSALRNKQLLPSEIKADVEKQDLPINESELAEYKEVITPVESITSSQEGKTKLGINAVSTENMQVLEQFESAMLEVDEDETANC